MRGLISMIAVLSLLILLLYLVLVGDPSWVTAGTSVLSIVLFGLATYETMALAAKVRKEREKIIF